jgi:Type IV secretion system pilin
MKISIKTALAGLLAVPALALGVALFAPVTTPVSAVDLSIQGGVNAAQGSSASTVCLFTGVGTCTDGIFTTIVNVLLFIIGAISVIMLIIGGIRYTVSGGDSSAVTGAKNTILYAIIGLVVAFLAFAVVNWVLAALAP